MGEFAVFRGLLFAAALAAPAAAGAVSWNVAADFSNPVFAYGSGTNGSSFAALPYYTGDNCFGVSGLACYQSAPSSHPVIAMKSGSDYNSGGVYIPTSTLYLHPADGQPGTDALLQFTAGTASTYRLTGFFQRQDTTNNGDGTAASIYSSTSPSALFSAILPGTSWGSQTSFGTIDVFLNAGQTVTFGVGNNGGSYQFDSTGLGATITAVPEPAQWTLMIGSFGLVGFAARRRSLRVTYA
jgi:hypothetical protein